MRKLLYLLTLTMSIFILTGCEIISTNEFLGGNFIEADTEPPEIIYPKNNVITDMSVTLNWEKIAGASSYHLKIASDSNFTNIIIDKRINQNFYEFGTDNAVTCYWKIRANVTIGEVPVNSFTPLDAVYVWGDSASVVIPTGSRNQPFKRIQDALNLAEKLKLDVRVAAVSGEYIESFNAVNGINIYGGYNATDNWETRDTVSNQTSLRGDGVITVAINDISDTTVVDGFSIHAKDGGETYAVYMASSSEKMILQNNIISGGSCEGSSFAVYAVESNSKIFRNIINIGDTLSDTGASSGIFSESSSLHIQGNIIKSSETASRLSVGIFEKLSSSTIGNNSIEGGEAGFSMGLQIYDSSPVIVSNVITTKKGSLYSYPLYLLVENYQSNPILVNNIIFGQYDLGANLITEQSGSGSILANPGEISHNLLFNASPNSSSTLYLDNGSTMIDDNWGTENIDDILKTRGEGGSPVTTGTIEGNITCPSGDEITDLTTIFEDPHGLNDDPWDDYKPKAGNRAIRKGTNIYNNPLYDSITTDILGNPRPESGAWNIGPFE